MSRILSLRRGPSSANRVPNVCVATHHRKQRYFQWFSFANEASLRSRFVLELLLLSLCCLVPAAGFVFHMLWVSCCAFFPYFLPPEGFGCAFSRFAARVFSLLGFCLCCGRVLFMGFALSFCKLCYCWWFALSCYAEGFVEIQIIPMVFVLLSWGRRPMGLGFRSLLLVLSLVF